MKQFTVAALVILISAGGAWAQIGAKVPPANTSVIPVSVACGVAPVAPPGCRSSVCMCDQSGTRCSWQFECSRGLDRRSDDDYGDRRSASPPPLKFIDQIPRSNRY